jgi:hypothetical protein
VIAVTPYWDWIRSEAAANGTDGCTGVTAISIDCCYEHDLAYQFAKDPRDAYRHSYDPDVAPGEQWIEAKPITREEADARFRQCLSNRSAWGNWSFVALYRWAAVRWQGQRSWDRYRAAEREQEAV